MGSCFFIFGEKWIGFLENLLTKNKQTNKMKQSFLSREMHPAVNEDKQDVTGQPGPCAVKMTPCGGQAPTSLSPVGPKYVEA
jgi:hypothetical protein